MINKITFEELCNNKEWKKAVIVFTEDSFKQEYSVEARSYEVSSKSNYFQNGKISKALSGNCLDGSENGVRLDWYLNVEWQVEYCYIVE